MLLLLLSYYYYFLKLLLLLLLLHKTVSDTEGRLPLGQEPLRRPSEALLGFFSRYSDRNLGAVTSVSGGLLRAVNSSGPKDHERAGAGSRTYDGGGRAGHTGGAGV